jgi:probable phosphoglycerate mutase
VERPAWDIWNDGPEGGETVDEVGSRADHAIARAVEADGDVALFAHGHLLRILGARWIGLRAAYGGHLMLSTGSLCRLGFERERRVILLWNDTSHQR